MIALLLCLAMTTPQSSARPKGVDFSGDWILVLPATPADDVASTMTVKQPVVDKNVYGAPMPPAYIHLIVERRGRSGASAIDYLIGALGSTTAFGPGRGPRTETKHSVSWEGESLVIANSSWSGSPDDALKMDMQRTETWRLDSGGKLLITIVDLKGSLESRTELTYRRR